MCGITGVLGSGEDALVRDMTAALRHRGPDGCGLHRHDRLRLGARRLAIVDVDGGCQPMYDEQGRICLVANGEIYNHAALRRELLGRGHRFASRSDIEVIVHLYEEYGDRCVEYLDGMFAFALADGDRLLLARDRFGIKPLYYSVLPDAGLLLFGSEIKALLRCRQLRPALDLQALADSLVLGYPVDERTVFEGVRCLPPGHMLTATGHDDVKITGYQPVPAESAPVEDPDEAQERLLASLHDAVASHLAADVEVGLMLSGGLDSTLLAVVMREITGAGFRTFAVADRTDHPDAIQAARVSKELGSRHETTVVGFDEYMDAVPRCVLALEQPLGPAGMPMYLLSAGIARHLKVCLSGEGADELFGGYAEYFDPAQRLRLVRPRLDAVTAHGLSLSPRAAEIVDGMSARPFPEYLRRVFADNMREQLVGQHLEPLDKAGMAAGLEIRVPYLDQGVARLVESVPLRHRVHSELGIHKYLLKRAALRRYPHVVALTDAVLRPKLGAPSAGRRHRQTLGRLCDKVLPDRYRAEHEFGPCFPDKLGLLVFDLFREIFLDGRGTLPDGLSMREFIRDRAGRRDLLPAGPVGH
jgi:asparagine synthase (glutamine-hydrolysing)